MVYICFRVVGLFFSFGLGILSIVDKKKLYLIIIQLFKVQQILFEVIFSELFSIKFSKLFEIYYFQYKSFRYEKKAKKTHKSSYVATFSKLGVYFSSLESILSRLSGVFQRVSLLLLTRGA